MAVNDLVERDERPAYVQFERVAVEDKAATLEAGLSVSKDVDYALITPPYSKDCVRLKIQRWRDTNKYEAKMGRLPQKWLDQWEQMYQAWKDGHEMPLNGTPIKTWSAISPAKIKNLLAIGIYTVEDLAQANAQGMSRIGMGANELKRMAVNWLASADDKGKVSIRITKLETDKARDDLTIESLTEKVKQLSAQLEAKVNGQEVTADAIVSRSVITAEDIMDQDFKRADTLTAENIDPPRVVNYQGMGHYELIEAHKVRFGKAPHPKAKDATIRQKLEE